MPYQPSPTDAIAVYIAATTWLYNVSPETMERPRLSDVEVNGWGEYHIAGGRVGCTRGKTVTVSAICLYDPATGEWEVYFPHGGTLRVDCNEDDDFVVVVRRE